MNETRVRVVAAALIAAAVSATGAAQGESFEKLPVGPIPKHGLEGELGAWLGLDGEISTRRAKTGAKALRIAGGTRRQVTLQLRGSGRPGLISFWAERWTRQQPFELRLEVRIGPSWELVYRDTGAAVRIGGYHARVEVPVTGAFDALRFECTSPDGAGVLLDDLSIAAPAPMRVTAVTSDQPILPVLLGLGRNPLVRVRVETEGYLEPVRLRSLRFSLGSSAGEELADLAGVSVFHSRTEAFPERSTAAQFGTIANPTASLTLTGNRVLSSGANYFWLSVALQRDRVDLAGHVDADCLEVVTSAGRFEPKAAEGTAAARQKLGVVVRDRGDAGVHTYRIPGITTTDKGTLVAVYDIRRRSGADLPGDIDVGMSRSRDGGRTWEPMRVILDMGDAEEWRHDGVGDPAILFDTVSKTLWVAATWSHGNRSWRGSGPGTKPEETGQLMLVSSRDDGQTWSEPVNITGQVKDPKWSFVLQSPGRGITTADGTLVFGAQFLDAPKTGRVPYSTILYSKDRGATWRIGTGARADTTECQPVEAASGRILLNMRDNRGGTRSVMVTADLGATWQAHPTDRKALVEPTCNAGLLALPRPAAEAPWLVFVNPAVPSAPRRMITLRLSRDGGLTWPHALVLDSGTSAGYASLTPIDGETLGVLYESSRAQLVFQQVRLAELTGR